MRKDWGYNGQNYGDRKNHVHKEERGQSKMTGKR